MSQALEHYREFAPCEALREHVRAFFSFTAPEENQPTRRPIHREVRFHNRDPFCSPLFADGHVSMAFSFGRAYRADGLWHSSSAGPRAYVIGAMTVVGRSTIGERADTVGIYFHAARAPRFLHLPASELADRVVPVEDIWGQSGPALLTQLGEAGGEETRIDRLESALLERVAEESPPTSALDVPGLAAWVLGRRGQVSVQSLAEAAGISRQHLAREFRDAVGVTPKVYCRLARFQAALAYASPAQEVDWAQAAVEMGYSDQSHMIAEFRQYSSLTPGALARERWFHPFIERARRSR